MFLYTTLGRPCVVGQRSGQLHHLDSDTFLFSLLPPALMRDIVTSDIMKDSQVDHWLDNPHFGAGSFRRSRPRSGFSSNGGSTANVSPRSSVGSSHSTNSINHGPALDCRPTWRTQPVSRTSRHSNLDPTSLHALGRSSIQSGYPARTRVSTRRRPREQAMFSDSEYHNPFGVMRDGIRSWVPRVRVLPSSGSRRGPLRVLSRKTAPALRIELGR